MEKPSQYAISLDLYILMHRIFGDPLPGEADVVYPFTETSDNQRSVLKKAAEILHAGRAKKIAVADGNDQNGYPGSGPWVAELTGVHNVAHNDIVLVEHKDRSKLNTYHEFIEFVKFALTQNWKSVAIVAPPFHLPRAYITAVSAMLKCAADEGKDEKFWLKIYAQCGVAEPWNVCVHHSQGKISGTRQALLAGELNRLVKYHEKGDLLKPTDVIYYLNWRDTR